MESHQLPANCFIIRHFALPSTPRKEVASSSALPSTCLGKMCVCDFLVSSYSPEIANWWFQPLWKIWESDWIIIPTGGENNSHVPNHQPGNIMNIPYRILSSLHWSHLGFPGKGWGRPVSTVPRHVGVVPFLRPDVSGIRRHGPLVLTHQTKVYWIGLRENLQETMVFTIKYRAFL
jgi:hypothetical protein